MDSEKLYSTDKQEVFETAREVIKFCFNLELTLAQQSQLRNIWVPKGIERYNTRDHWFMTAPPVAEAVSEFMAYNFTISRKLLDGCISSVNCNPLEILDPLAQAHIEIQQDRMHLF